MILDTCIYISLNVCIFSVCFIIVCMSRSIWKDKQPKPKANPDHRPTIGSHGAHWNLNQRQHYQFVLYALAILRTVHLHTKYSQDAIDYNGDENAKASARHIDCIINKLNAGAYPNRYDLDADNSEFDDLHTTMSVRAVMLGRAGCGKSYVLECALDFERAWGLSGRLVSTSTTGASAMNVMGVTYFHALASSPKWNLQRTSDKFKATAEAWSPVGCLCIDEAGKLGGKEVHHIENLLRWFKEPSEYYGGIDFICTLDNYQPDNMRNCYTLSRPGGQEERHGLYLWRHTFNAAVELIDRNRLKDPEFAEVTDR